MIMRPSRHRASKRHGAPSAQREGKSRLQNQTAKADGLFAAKPEQMPAARSAAAPGVFELTRDWRVLSIGALLFATFVWSYWPSFADLLQAWEHEPDYAHGYLVPPVALWFLWSRREAFPGLRSSWAWSGLLLIGASTLVRFAGSLWYMDSLQHWSMPIWLAGICWLLGGRSLLKWALPAVLFLGFMIPLPFRAERVLSLPLQSVATRLSCWILQSVGEPAFAEGHIIVIGNQAEQIRLEIAEACSGLRIFVSITALAFAYVVLINKPRWTKLAVACSVLPVALLTNALRIVATGLLHSHISGEAAHRFSHDAAGWAMIPLAAAMLAGVIWYVDRLIVEVETVSAGDLLSAAPSPSLELG